MEFTAAAIAQLLKGKVEGNPEVKVSNVSKIEEGKPGTLAFLANSKYESYLYTTNASIVLINNDFKLEKEISATLIRVNDAYEAFASLLDIYYQAQQAKTGIEEMSFVDPSAKIGEDVYIANFAYISPNAQIGDNVKIYPHVFIGDNVKIDDNTILYAGVKVCNNCIISKNCILHAGVVIGADGFGFAPQSATAYKKVPQVGNVIIEENVEIGANTTIDRATMGSTIIRKGVKLDNLIQIAHNVEIDENTVIAALTGISGSTKIGKNCMIAGQVGMVGHAYMADEVKVGAQSGIIASVKEKGAVLLGSPAWDAGDMKKSLVGLRKLPDLMKKISLLEKEINELKNK